MRTISGLPISTADTDIFHFALANLLPTDYLLAVNTSIRTLSLLIEGPRLLKQQQFTENEMHLFLPIKETFPHYCPYEVLLASITAYTVKPTYIKQWQQRLKKAQMDGTWHQELRPLSRTLSSLRSKLHSFDLEISTIREKGCSLTSLRPLNQDRE